MQSFLTSDLRRFRWHTGAALRRPDPEESLPVLFRDVGPVATAMFLRGQLPRLAGPMSPIAWMRTADYVEPYTDHGAIGRLVILQPRVLEVWHGGPAHVFIADGALPGGHDAIGWVPGGFLLPTAARQLRGALTFPELREVFGGQAYDECRAEAARALDLLNAEALQAEQFAAPLRLRFQTGTLQDRNAVRQWFAEVGLHETDLCAAWHHLSRERRDLLKELLPAAPGLR